MLHEDTKVLTKDRNSQKIKDLTIGEELVTIYGSTEILKISKISGPICQIILANSKLIYCSTDQKFLIKIDEGYIFKVPEKNDLLLSFTHLMELIKIQQVNILSSGPLVKVHLKTDYTILIDGLFVCKS